MKKQLLMKTFLVAVCLLGGANFAWADTETITVLSENYESYTANADITSTLTSAGWTWTGKSGTNPTATCTQGESVNLTKYGNLYYAGGSSRQQYWNFSSSVTNALTADNWTLTFSAAITPGNTDAQSGIAVSGASSTFSSTAMGITNPYFSLYNSAAKGTTYTAKIGATSLSGTYTLASGTWYKFTIRATNINTDNNTATVYVKVTSYNGETTILENTQSGISISPIGNLEGIVWGSSRYYSRLLLDDVLLTKEVDASVCADPTYTITSAAGTGRKFTLVCETPESTIYYAASELAKGADGWTEYSAEVTTDAEIIYVYAQKGTATSNIINFATGAGTEVKLNAPTISRSGNTVTISSNQSDKVGNPSATIYYTYGDGEPVEYSDAITVVADATITAYATADGYTNSDNATRAVALFPTDVANVINAPENNTYTTGALSGVDVVGTNATFRALMIDGSQWGGENVFVQSTNFGYRNGGAGKDWFFDSTSDVWLLVKNLKAGDIIVANTSYQASNLDNATYTEKYSEGNNRVYTVTADGDVELAFKKPGAKTMNYIYGLYVWSHHVSKTITSAGWTTYCSPYALDLNNATGLTEAYIVTGGADGVLTTTSVKSGTVPANTGLLIKGPEGTATIPVVATSETDVSANKLKGVTVETPGVAAGIYVLLNGTNGVGFYETTDAFTVGANTAYLPDGFDAAVAPADARGFYSFGDATGIGATLKNKGIENKEVYNLKGQRVAAPTKGLYIVNGKKVVVK